MKRTKAIYLIIFLALAGIFAAQGKRPSDGKAGEASPESGGLWWIQRNLSAASGGDKGGAITLPDPPEGYNDAANEPMFYYTEGIKQAKLYDNKPLAVEMFDRAVAIDPMYSPAYYEAANALSLSDPLRALQYCERANLLDSTNVWYRAQLGRLLLITENYERAQKIYEQLIELSPRSPENYSMLAALYSYNRQPYSAIAVLDKAEQVVGTIEQLSAQKRELLIGVGLYDRAIDEARALAASYPYNYESYLALAELYAQTRKDSLAMENYNMALALNPEGMDVIGSLSEYYKLKGDNQGYLQITKKIFQSKEIPLELKLQHYREITANRNFYRENYFQIRDLAATLRVEYPADYEVLEHYAETLIAWGDVEEAATLFKSYLSDTITDIKPYENVLDLEAYLNRSDSINKYTELALRRFPQNPDLHLRHGSALAYMKKEKEAIKAFEQAYKYSQTDSARSVTRGIIGDTYHTMGNDKKAYKEYDKALKIWPDNVIVLNNYAYFLSEEDRELEKALVMAEKVMKLEPGNATYIDTYGWVLYKLGRFDEAKKAIQQAIAIDIRKSSELLIHYGDILFALGDSYMASVYWKRALEAGHDEKVIERRLEAAGQK